MQLQTFVKRCTGIEEVMGSNPVEAWIFFSGLNFSTAQVVPVYHSEDRFHVNVFIRSSNIWLSYIHSRLLQLQIIA